MITKEEIAALMDIVGDAIKGYVSSAVSDISSQFDVKIKSLPSAKDGVDGKSITIEEVSPVLERYVSEAVSKIPVPKDGQNGRNAFEVAQSLGYEGTVHEWMESLIGSKGEKGEAGESIKGDPGPPGTSGEKGEPGVDGKSVTLDELRPLIEEAVKAIPTPKDGKDGKDGASVTIDQVMPELKSELQKAIDAIPHPKDGRDGTDGKPGKDGADGKSVTVDDIRKEIELQHTKFFIEFERGARDVLQRLFDSVPKPKDGLDGLGFDDMEEVFDGERTVTRRFKRGDQVKEFIFKIPALIERGVYRDGTAYERGDGVTAGGNYWIAQKDTKLRPGDNNTDWRLAVRKGRDGKDFVPARAAVR